MRFFSGLLITIGVAIVLLIFGPVIQQELQYDFNQISHVSYSVKTSESPLVNGSFQKTITPPNTDFSIIIPKINAAAPIVSDVDPVSSKAYLAALKNGVAHASSTAYPGMVGNVYLFAHSTDTFYNIGKYNAVFFLIGKLKAGDEINVYYRGNLYKYIVYDKKVVDATDIQYLGTLITGEKTLTLQTCYPPGTTIKRLVVLAKMEK